MTPHKRTVFVFATEQQQHDAKTVLLTLNVPFTANLKYPYWVDTTAKRANQHNLTAKLSFHKTFSNR